MNKKTKTCQKILNGRALLKSVRGAGFTLVELLVVVLIVGVLTSIALPQYMLSIERSRAMEAMIDVKAINDAVYAYAAGRPDGGCPDNFKKLVISIPGTLLEGNTQLRTRDFTYELNRATNAYIPGTNCPGVVAIRNASEKYDYQLWNPYRSGTSGQGATLACTGTEGKGKKICDSFQMYTSVGPY